MKKQFLILMVLLSFLTIGAFGQQKDIQNLVLSVVEKVVPAEFSYFHLVDSSFILRYPGFDKQELKAFLKENPGFDPEAILAERTKAKKFNWSDFKIPRARINPYEKIPHYDGRSAQILTLAWNIPDSTEQKIRRNNKHFDVVLKLDKDWTKAQQRAAIQKEEERYASRLKTEDKKCFVFSTPAFSKNRRYAIIEAKTAREGWCLIYKKIKGKWVYQITLSNWMA
ncbi:hypothetical protein [Niabella hirudinis]|uniref:hypothetical protein n=1 Tax=Niabella hirudinis TaxID=1285929 RepID=UPI003EC01CEC